LRDFWNKFCSMYINNILIFINKSFHQHCKHIWKMLLWLQETELQIDIDKCEFEIKTIKYLEFILKIEKNIQINSQKMKVIVNWKASWSVKSVQSFIDFANFYWKFIKNFLSLIMLIMTLIWKNIFFKWSKNINLKFKKLKTMFIAAPILI